MLAGSLSRAYAWRRDRRPQWHAEYPLPDSMDAIAMVMAAHQAMTGAVLSLSKDAIDEILPGGFIRSSSMASSSATLDFTVRPGLTEPWRSAIPWYQPGVAAALPAGRAG